MRRPLVVVGVDGSERSIAALIWAAEYTSFMVRHAPCPLVICREKSVDQ